MVAAAAAGAAAEECDHFSFDDSDRFEEDSICTWSSEPESMCNNWRGWKKPSQASGGVATNNNGNGNNNTSSSFMGISMLGTTGGVSSGAAAAASATASGGAGGSLERNRRSEESEFCFSFIKKLQQPTAIGISLNFHSVHSKSGDDAHRVGGALRGHVHPL